MKKSIIYLFMAMWLGGCVSFDARSMHPVETALKQQYPDVRIYREFEITVGTSVFGLIDMMIDEDDMDFDLSKLDRAEIGVYEIRNLPSLDEFELPVETLRLKHCPVKEELVNIREEDEFVLIIGCLKGEELRNVFVVVIEPDELTLVSASGDYEEIMKLAMNTADLDDDHFGDFETDHDRERKSSLRRIY